jgi:hypothetical protein
MPGHGRKHGCIHDPGQEGAFNLGTQKGDETMAKAKWQELLKEHKDTITEIKAEYAKADALLAEYNAKEREIISRDGDVVDEQVALFQEAQPLFEQWQEQRQHADGLYASLVEDLNAAYQAVPFGKAASAGIDRILKESGLDKLAR